MISLLGNWTYSRTDSASDVSEAEDADEALMEDEDEYYVVDEDADIDEKADVPEKASLTYKQVNYCYIIVSYYVLLSGLHSVTKVKQLLLNIYIQSFSGVK